LNRESVDRCLIDYPFGTDRAKAKAATGASKSIPCIIVTGTPLCVKTIVTQALSKAFQLPVVDLHEIW
jgi:hypothetical protein